MDRGHAIGHAIGHAGTVSEQCPFGHCSKSNGVRNGVFIEQCSERSLDLSAFGTLSHRTLSRTLSDRYPVERQPLAARFYTSCQQACPGFLLHSSWRFSFTCAKFLACVKQLKKPVALFSAVAGCSAAAGAANISGLVPTLVLLRREVANCSSRQKSITTPALRNQ